MKQSATEREKVIYRPREARVEVEEREIDLGSFIPDKLINISGGYVALASTVD